MYMFAVSPGYLRYLKIESDGYEFKFQGYSSFKEASEGLMKVNCSEYMGFAVVMDRLPENTKRLEEFIKKCDIISESSPIPKRFVFAMMDTTGLVELLKSGGYKHLEFYRASYEVLTDLFIRQEIFGTILEAHFTPYGRKPVPERKPSIASLKGLRLVPPISPTTLKAIEKVQLRPTLNETMVEDLFLEDLKSVNKILYTLRMYYISLYFQSAEELKKELTSLISEVVDKSLNLQYSMLLEYVERGVENERRQTVALQSSEKSKFVV